MQNSIAQIVEFMKVLDKVCLVKRDTLLSDGTPETDSSHSFKLAFWVMLVYPYLKRSYNYTRLLELALVHDIAEAETGDYPNSVQRVHPEIKQLKKEQELQAMQKYRTILPQKNGDYLFGLYQEYEEKQTPESVLVSALDKMDAGLQANFYHNGDVRYWLDCENGEQYAKISTEKKEVVARLDEEFVTKLEEEVIKISKENMRRWPDKF